MQKKLRIGLFSFTCDEGCSMIFLEMLNNKFFEWQQFIDFAYCRLLKEKNELNDLDLAFIEGAIATCEEELMLKRIRANAKKLIAIGSCAINGMPSNQRNFFQEKELNEIKPILERFCHLEKVKAPTEIVKVDETIPGCPVIQEKFEELIEKYIKEFKVKKCIE